jgi:formate hydrogenlyase subunit 3/multisubunit Na+/H+ antiporter MnhD subunit
MMTEVPWIAWTIVAPLSGAALSVLSEKRATMVTGFASLATIACVTRAVWQVGTRGVLRHAVGGWSAPLGITLRADGLAALLLTTFAVVGPLVSTYALRRHRRLRRRANRFLSLWLFAWAALDALALSADVFNLYVTLELVTLAAVGMIVLDGMPEALDAGLRYLLLALVGSLFYLTGVAFLYAMTATLDIELLRLRTTPGPTVWTALSLMTVGLCLKAGLFPLHAWLRPAYASPTPMVGALLSGLIGKAPYVVLLRLWLEVFPAAVGVGAARLLGILGAAGVLWGSLLALRQRRLKRALAYSSLAHVGYLFLLFPLGTSLAYAGAVYVVVSHAAASASMFTAAGIVERSVGHDDLEALKGVAHRRPLTFFALGLAGTSLMGLPPSGGFVAKWLLARAALERGEWWWAAVVVAGGLLAAAYVFPILRGAFEPLPPGLELRAVPRRHEIVSLTLAVLAVAPGIAPARALALLQVTSRP